MFELFEKIQSYVSGIWTSAQQIWDDGGWAMIAIAIIGLVMFLVGLQVAVRLRRTGYKTVPESSWRKWIDDPVARRGPIGEMLDYAVDGASLESTTDYFRHMRATETAPFERDLKVMKTCVSAAPLVGLLGTVTGMLTTFGGLSSGSGGDQTMGVIAGGISEALITTETGLVIALPGLFMQFWLMRNFERYKAFLAHLESVCTQAVYRRSTPTRSGTAA